jgi:Immunity protein 74
MFDTISKLFSKFRTIRNIDSISSMERLGRDEYKYIEGDRALTVQVEMLSGTPRRVIYSRTIKNWMPPHDNEIITEDKRKEIVANICKYFEMNNISYTVK